METNYFSSRISKNGNNKVGAIKSFMRSIHIQSFEENENKLIAKSVITLLKCDNGFFIIQRRNYF